MTSLKPIQAENRQGEALYRVRIVDTAPTRIFMLMKDIGPELARPNVLLVGVISKISQLPDGVTPNTIYGGYSVCPRFPVLFDRSTNAFAY